jgi:predicted lactoylglutathione lyase
MSRMIFVNLPVADLDVSTAFYTGLGFAKNAEFSDDRASCIVISETIYVMLLTREFFAEFITGEIAPSGTTQVLPCLSASSPAEVDELVNTALALGGKPWRPTMHQGSMYGHSFCDPDGHAWELVHMDLAAEGADAG